MNRDELRKRAEVLVSPRTRLLAIVTGCVSAVAGSLPVGPLFAVLPAILIFGAVLQRWSPRPGRWLMWLGAFFLTLDVGGFFIPPVIRPPHSPDTTQIVILLLFIVSIGLVCWCDVALFIDSRKSKNVPPWRTKNSLDQRVG